MGHEGPAKVDWDSLKPAIKRSNPDTRIVPVESRD